MATAKRRYAYFSFLYALATVFFHAEQAYWFAWSWDTPPLLAAFAVLLKPSSWKRLAVLVLLQTLHFGASLPFVNTNRTLQGLTALTMLCGLVAVLRSRGEDNRLTVWLRAVETPLRLELVIVYFYAFFHKFNWDFLNPDLSCGVTLYQQVARGVAQAAPFLSLPQTDWAHGTAIWGTLILEAALPVMLLVPRLRASAFFIGVLFHGLLGVGYFYGFSATMIALLFLSAPPSFSDRIGDVLNRLLNWGLLGRLLGDERVRTATAAILIAASLLPEDVQGYSWALWCALAAAAPAVLLWWVWPGSGAALMAEPAEMPRPHPAMLLFPALTFLNGASPFLGLKTEYSFAMYSNLRTEGGRSNHVLTDSVWYLADYQSELVSILESSDVQLGRFAARRNDVPLAWVRRRIWELTEYGEENIRVVYELDGVRREVDAAENDPVLSEPLSFLERKFLRFRKIPRGENVCRH